MSMHCIVLPLIMITENYCLFLLSSILLLKTPALSYSYDLFSLLQHTQVVLLLLVTFGYPSEDSNLFGRITIIRIFINHKVNFRESLFFQEYYKSNLILFTLLFHIIVGCLWEDNKPVIYLSIIRVSK